MINKSITESQRKNATAHMGPGDSYPVDSDGEHLRAAWDLAGHAANPEQVRRNIISFARRHGLLDHLPETAKDSMMAKKATTMEDLLLEWFGPEEVQKSYNPLVKSFTITKAWDGEEGLNIEGWVSTNDQDQEQDITEPEAFAKSLDSYFQRAAPVSYNHNLKDTPVGHLRKGALVRDGKIFHESLHPLDPADFEHFPGAGTGFYARGILTDPTVSGAVRKGNIGGFSFIGNATRYQRLPGGGRRFTEINPLLETTVAPYPINQQAAILAAKAYGLEEEELP